MAAQRALEEACQKQANVQRWSRVLDEERFSFQAQTQALRVALQADIPNALAQLDQMIAALEGYASTAIPQQQTSTAPQIPEETSAATELPSMARTPPAPPAQRPPIRLPRELIATYRRRPSRARPHGLSRMPPAATARTLPAACPDPCDADAESCWPRLQSRHTYLGDCGASGRQRLVRRIRGRLKAAAYDARAWPFIASDWAAVLALPPGCLVTWTAGA